MNKIGYPNVDTLLFLVDFDNLDNPSEEIVCTVGLNACNLGCLNGVGKDSIDQLRWGGIGVVDGVCEALIEGILL